MRIPFTRSWYESALSWRIAVYVPSTNGNETINNAAYVKDALTHFSQWFGGASATKIAGSWLGESGLVIENTVIVYSYTKTLTPRSRLLVQAYAQHLKTILKQESVAIELVKVKGGLFLL